MKRRADTWILISDVDLALRILASLHTGIAIELYGHKGVVMKTEPAGENVKVLLVHVGPQTCSCPVIGATSPNVEEQ